MDQLLTYKKGNLGPDFNFTAYIYIYAFLQFYIMKFVQSEANLCDEASYGLVEFSMVLWALWLLSDPGTHLFDICPFRPPKWPFLDSNNTSFWRTRIEHKHLLLEVFGHTGISRQNPGISKKKTLVSLGFEGHADLLAPTPSRGRPPPHPKKSGPKSLGLGSFFFPEF